MTAPTERVIGLCSLLHEPAAVNSATRSFADRPVLTGTLARLIASEEITALAVLCWDDQHQPVAEAAGEVARASGVAIQVLPHGARRAIPSLDVLTAAQRWSDGWRGGLLGTIPTDAGYFAPSMAAVARALKADALLLVDPSSALLDPALIAAIVVHARRHPEQEIVFTPAAPGLSGVLLRPGLLAQLAESQAHPGVLLHYRPDSPQLDPISGDGCCHAPTAVARSLADFRLNSGRKLAWAEQWLEADLCAEALCAAAAAAHEAATPREVTIEPTTRRSTRPLWIAPSPHFELDLPDVLAFIEESAAEGDDLRLTFAGRGDPLLWPALPQAIAHARRCGIERLHIDTDLLPARPEAISWLATAELDIVSIQIPAMTPGTYAAVAGVDRLAEVLVNLRKLLLHRGQTGGGTGAGLPIVVPTFVKTRHNLGEMEGWYDQWLGATGCAVVRGPDALGNEAPSDVTTAVMIRSERRAPEVRLLADGTLADECNVPLGAWSPGRAAAAWARRRAATPAAALAA